ncbi:peptidoglycan-binding protein [Luteimicrobium sp. NPDC057192]|uniref:peptidoglycan-binding domain-containing protein n=1 Tax=Luteimicrobium sp. NPDC057192 TaxID=3346042 RepID=UPI00362899EB
MTTYRTPAQALAWADQHDEGYNGECERYAREAYGIPAGAGSAAEAWAEAKHKHTDLDDAPDGAFIFFSKAGDKYGHVGLKKGNQLRSTDSAKGHPHTAPLSYWTGAGYKVLGWTEDNNGVRIAGLKPKAASKPATSSGSKPAAGVLALGSKGKKVGALQAGLRKVFPAYQETVKVKRGQLIAVDDEFGAQTEAWVKHFQTRTGLVADGIVGPKTVAKLASFGINL